MFELSTIDWAAVAKIVGIDIMLGGDNAVVIALACSALPLALRNKGMFFGTAGAVLMRGLLLAIAGLVMGIPFVKLVAGAWLFWIGYSLLVGNDDDPNINPSESLFGAIKTIIIADVMMSVDNVMAVASAAQSAGEHSTIYAVAGIMFSIPVIVLGAQIIMKLMDRFPIITWGGAGLLGWVGAEMIISDSKMHDLIFSDPSTHLIFKILGFGAVVLAALAQKKFSKQQSKIQEA
ncbi:MAG TPA: TerC family protein [Methanosarcina sp.]|nr:TerC family protein [Methanosarcina sp.]